MTESIYLSIYVHFCVLFCYFLQRYQEILFLLGDVLHPHSQMSFSPMQHH